MKKLLEVENLHKHYIIRDSFGNKKILNAVDGVDFSISEGETVGLVGESGCGKSTIAKLLLGLIPSDQGEIHYLKKDWSKIPLQKWDEYRNDIQILFQNSNHVLNPRWKVENILKEAGSNYDQGQINGVLGQVGLSAIYLNRYPHQLSGGQRQRIAIARALLKKPKILICDEPVAGLDVSIQAQIILLLNQLKTKNHLTLIFISHDLLLVRLLCERVLIMKNGKIIESGKIEKVFDSPEHAYTKHLIDVIPSFNK